MVAFSCVSLEMDSEYSRRKTLKLTWDDDASSDTEEAQSPARKAREHLYSGPPEGFRPRFIQAFASAGAGVGLIAVAMAFIVNGAWAFLTAIAFLLSFYALKMANDDVQTYEGKLQEPHVTELQTARTWALGSLMVILSLLVILTLAMLARIAIYKTFYDVGP
jgi:hypothetical protein